MTKKRYSISEVLTTDVLEKVLTNRQPEVLVLRGHGLIEAALLSLLAARLGVSEDELPVLNSFDALARIALAGRSYSPMLAPVLHLNRIRNIVAHELEARDAETLMTEFLATMPPDLADAPTKRGVAITETFAASLMVVMYALMQLRLDEGAEQRTSSEPTNTES